MKKIKYLILVLCLSFMPFVSISAEDNIEQNNEEIQKFNVVSGDSLNGDYQVDGSSIIAGNNISVKNTIKGIDMVFGNNIDYSGNSDYSLVAGNIVSVKGITKNDGFVFGNAITFDKEYKASRDLFVFGNSVTLRGEITRNLTIYSSTVILEDAKINGNVTINAADIKIKNATVEGTLEYNEDAEISIDETAIINSKNTFKQDANDKGITNIILTNIVDYLSVLLVFAVSALVLPSMFKKIENKTENMSVSKFLSMLGYGLFFLILIPIIFIILLMTTIGIPLALLLLTIYIIVICLSMIFSGYFIGLLIWKKFIKKDVNILLVGLLGISIIKILSLIPYVSIIISFISLLLSLSIFIKLFTKDA